MLPRIPLTKNEVTSPVHDTKESGDLATLGRLAELASASARITTALKLNRAIAHEELFVLRGDWAFQAALASILSAVRFNYFAISALTCTQCPTGAAKAWILIIIPSTLIACYHVPVWVRTRWSS